MERQLLRIAETAEILGIGRTRAYELTRKGEIPSIRVGKSVRVPINALKFAMPGKVASPNASTVAVYRVGLVTNSKSPMLYTVTVAPSSNARFSLAAQSSTHT